MSSAANAAAAAAATAVGSAFYVLLYATRCRKMCSEFLLRSTHTPKRSLTPAPLPACLLPACLPPDNVRPATTQQRHLNTGGDGSLQVRGEGGPAWPAARRNAAAPPRLYLDLHGWLAWVTAYSLTLTQLCLDSIKTCLG